MVGNEAGFDGLAQTCFIGEHHPGGVSAADFTGNVILVGNEIQPSSQKAPGGGFLLPCPGFQDVPAQAECLGFPGQSGHEFFLGQGESHVQGKGGFHNLLSLAGIGQKPVLFLNAIHHPFFPIFGAQGVSGFVGHPLDGGGAFGITTGGFTAWEMEIDASFVLGNQNTDAQFRLSLAHVALARCKYGSVHGMSSLFK